ncbi:SusC/RagA family TonB-linked outer membrane protein [Pontibacter cellulosilyticus]|uniref:SusC/RagA family TonB-linked outer membrane protein n=1 Tax=Pontibacter cellulosilyticus TaxID=1720253 RepID=A0A923N4Y0_9BACT|nr:SusC/RagA family TonB-linked outer membrane protein [Pontibacter cellulosilyticus]MBC5992239.1 SusC/RagA family TonB-linked outer membrane protein [Pontibacter cellulosilyticus]
MRNNFTLIILLLLLYFSTSAIAQEIPVSGKVTGADQGSPLPGVSVLVKGTTTGTTTDANGNFSIQVPSSNATLVFRYLGYETKEVQVGNQSVINVTLSTDTRQLSEVVVTAMGITREKKALGYAASTVETEELVQNRQANVLNAMQGKVAGATITSTGGAPGQGASIIIRGINSIDPNRSSDPLYVIDGVLIDNTTSTFGEGAELRGMSNRLADINPDNIESINILKGGAATALYGLRGANGVVVITTKRGQEGALRVNFTSTAGIEEVNKFPDMQDTYTQGYLGVYDPESFWPSWGPTVEEARQIDPTHPAELYNHFEDAYETGHQYRNSLSFSGGNNAITFYSSISHLRHEGVLPFTDYENIQARLNTDVKLSDKVTTGANFTFVNSGGNRYNADRFNESLSYWSPRWDVTDYIKPDGTMNTYRNNNPIYGAFTNKLEDDVNRFIGGLNFGYQPKEWLGFSYRIGLDTYTDDRTRTAPGPRGVADEIVYEDNGLGFVNEYTTKFRAINSTFITTLQSSFGENFNGTIRLGHELYDRKVKSFGVEGTELAVFDYFNLTNARFLTSVQQEEEYRLMGFFGEASVDYKNLLFLTLTGRNDITSSLERSNRSFFYPSVSLSYVFSEQFDLPSFINMGKLRLSYAEIGKDALPYSTSSGFANYTGLPTGYTGFTRAALLGNEDLRPEFTNTYEAGLEMSFLNNRLGFDFTYYYSLSKDQILNIQVASSTGFVRAAVNSGEMRNKGVEIALNAVPVQTNDFSWDTKLVFSANRNKILSIREGLEEIPYASQFGYVGSTVTLKLIPGQPYGNIYGSHYQRYYGPGEEEDPLFIDENRPIVIGANGFPVRAPLSSQKILGNSQPDWVGGLTNTFRYKNLSLTSLFDARQGFEKYNQLGNFFAAFGIAEYTENRNETIVFDGVLKDGTPNTKPVFLGQGIGPDGVNYGNGYYRNVYRGVSENFVEDASWVRLRSLTLSYTLPSSWFEDIFVRNASVSLTGNNLWLSTDYSGFDPETSSAPSGSNVDAFAGFTYPAVRSYLFTLNVGF